MKKALLLVLLCLVPGLTGCGSLHSQRRELAQLRLMESMGLDAAPGGLILSLSSAPSDEEEVLCFSGSGVSLSQAMEQLQSRAGEELFCGHLQNILVGERYAQGAPETLLSAVCRSSDLRLDQPVFLVLGATAREALESGSAASLRLLSPDREQAGSLSTAGGILRDLNRQGSSLIRALRLQPSAQEGEEDPDLVPAGYGILGAEGLLATLSPEEAMAAELLTGTLSPCPLLLRDRQGRAVTVELQDGSCATRPLFDRKGALTGLSLMIRASTVALARIIRLRPVRSRATVLEIAGFPSVAEEDYREELTALLEKELTGRVQKLLRRSRELGADFLGLGRRLELAAPWRCRGLGERLGEKLPELALRLRVQAELLHSNDIS